MFRSSRLIATLSMFLFFGASAGAQQYGFKYYGVEHGLTNLAVKALFQDREGFLWAGTEGGVFRYDGDRFRRFGQAEGLPDDASFSIGEAPDGSVWAGSSVGLYRLKGQRFQAVPLPVSLRVFAYAGILSNGAGTTYVATDHGLLAATAGQSPGEYSFRHVPGPAGAASAAVYGLSLDGSPPEKATLWFGCGAGVCRMSGGAIEALGAEAGLSPAMWIHVVRDRDGDLWAQEGRNLMVRRHGAVRFATAGFPLPGAGPGGPVVDGHGRLLIPTAEGLAIKEDGHFRMVGRTAGLRSSIYSVMEGRDGLLWIGLGGRGAARWLGFGEWEGFDAAGGLSDTVFDILPLSGQEVLAGAENGLFHGTREGDRWRWRRDPRIGEVPIRGLQREADGTLWIAAESKGVARVDGKSGQVVWLGKPQGLSEVSLLSLAIGRDRRIWAGTRNGLFVAALAERRFRLVTEVPRSRTRAVAVAPNGDLWVAAKPGLWHLSQGYWRSFSVAHGLLDDAILTVATRSPDEVWVGYRFSGTVGRLSLAGGKTSIVHYGPEQRAPSGITYFLGFDAANRLWVGTDQGVDTWDGKFWTRYSQDDGLIWNDCDAHAFAAEAGGAVWIGTSSGLAHFQPHAAVPRPAPPRVILSRVVLGGEAMDGAGPVSVDYRRNSLEVRFSALAFAREHATVFRYRLRPLFEDWRETSTHQLEFPGLPPQSYSFEVEARDTGREWTAKPATFSFQVRRPLWTTLPFYVLHGLIVLGLIVFVYRWRARMHEQHLANERKELERSRIVDEAQRHLDAVTHLNRVASLSEYAASLAHEITQPLAAISANAEVTMSMLDTPQPDLAEVRSALADILADDARAIGIVRRMRSFLRRGPHLPVALDLTEVATQVVNMVRYGAQERGIAIIQELTFQLPLVSGDKVQFQQVILNLINNAMEAVGQQPEGAVEGQGAAKWIAIRTALHVDGVLLEVEDSGPGIAAAGMEKLFEPFYTTKPDGLGMGLSISRSIVESSGGRIWAENGSRGGAVFRILLPVE
jgi:signal transduction histidine kinase/ligand-binding sensor domain-containing protein